MLRIDVVSIFPRMLEAPVSDSIMQRAAEKGLVSFSFHDLRDFTEDRHRKVDDSPFGGGPGMVMKPEPFFRAVSELLPEGPGPEDAVVLLSPRGRRFDQATARRFAGLGRLVLLCGRYEGVDERVARGVATEELSLGDFVLTGGEVAALAVIEASVRLLPGALGDEGSAAADSFGEGRLDFPHYTRPAEWRGQSVPEVLLSGHHAEIARWRRAEALLATAERRPDLLHELPPSAEEQRLLEQAKRGRPDPVRHLADVGR